MKSPQSHTHIHTLEIVTWRILLEQCITRKRYISDSVSYVWQPSALMCAFLCATCSPNKYMFLIHTFESLFGKIFKQLFLWLQNTMGYSRLSIWRSLPLKVDPINFPQIATSKKIPNIEVVNLVAVETGTNHASRVYCFTGKRGKGNFPLFAILVYFLRGFCTLRIDIVCICIVQWSCTKMRIYIVLDLGHFSWDRNTNKSRTQTHMWPRYVLLSSLRQLNSILVFIRNGNMKNSESEIILFT